MKEKGKLNLRELNQLVEKSTPLSIFSLVAKGIQGAGGGWAAGGLLVTVLSISGLAAGMALELASYISGAVIFAGIAIAISAYQLWKQREIIASRKESIDEKLLKLKKSVAQSFINYQLLEDTQLSIKEDISRLEKVLEHNKNIMRTGDLNDTVQYLKDELVNIDELKAQMLDRLKVSLENIQGESNSEKLAALFDNSLEVSKEDVILNFVMLSDDFKNKGNDVEKIKLSLDSFLKSINQPVSPSDQVTTFKEEMQGLIKPQNDKTNATVKRLLFGLTAIGGFLSGVGTAITITAFALGGMAALTGIGWPIAVAAMGVGLLGMAGALLYRRHVEKKQQKTLSKLSTAQKQIEGISKYIDQYVNQKALEKLNAIDNKYQETQQKVTGELLIHERTFVDCKKQIEELRTKIENCPKKEVTFFNHTPFLGDRIQTMEKAIKKNIVSLNLIRDQVSKTVIIIGSDDKKTTLLESIDHELKVARENEHKILGLYKGIKPRVLSAPPLENQHLVKSLNIFAQEEKNLSAPDLTQATDEGLRL